MKKLKTVVACALLAVGAAYAIAAYALPMPGPGQEVYIVYYSNAARIVEVGTRAGTHDEACAAWHVTWGITTPYSRVFVSNCPTNGGEF
jgi:hypothetical protein